MAKGVVDRASRGYSDNVLLAQRRDFRLVVAEAPEDFVGMLAEQRRRPAVGARSFGELDRSWGERHRFSQPGVGHLFEQPGGADVRIVERLLRGIDLARQDVGLFECRQRLAAAAPSTLFTHPRRDDLGIVGACLVVAKNVDRRASPPRRSSGTSAGPSPIPVATIQPSVQRKMSAGAELKPRLSVTLWLVGEGPLSARIAAAEARDRERRPPATQLANEPDHHEPTVTAPYSQRQTRDL